MIKYDEAKKLYRVSYSRRHPVTKQATSLTRTGIKTMEEAKKTYNELIIKMEQKFNRSLYPLWPEIVDRFIEHFRNRGIANNTVYNYKTGLYSHTVLRWEKKQINEITTSDIRELVLDSLGHKSEALRKDILKYIRATFTYALDMGIIQRDPTPKLKFKKTLKIKSVLKESEIFYFLKMAKEKNHPWFSIWAVALYTGMRNGELFALKWSDVDMEKGLITVQRSYSKRTKEFKSTKAGYWRTVPVSEDLKQLLLHLHQQHNHHHTHSCGGNEIGDDGGCFICAGNRRSVGEGFVLPRTKAWVQGQQALALKEFCAEIGLRPIRFHTLRACFATQLISEGVEPIKVMKVCGWMDLKTMARYVRLAGVEESGVTEGLRLL